MLSVKVRSREVSKPLPQIANRPLPVTLFLMRLNDFAEHLVFLVELEHTLACLAVRRCGIQVILPEDTVGLPNRLAGFQYLRRH